MLNKDPNLRTHNQIPATLPLKFKCSVIILYNNN